ncbi:Coupling of ubiquitin conjugation to ER degradation protein 1 [Smittium culicis]|uniref:Coupling of ubiquitin conjugation to ER degradation protein 1 n=1 Tax=Smittium culicis TaxID=133412 RepID=A0A1R1YFL3_9FUNG|nr:Coupling of ubiquitin conjugation to ER degradation protein 1 [Smittium culicis]
MNNVIVLLAVIAVVFFFFWMILGNNGPDGVSAGYPVREDHVRELLLVFPGIEEEAVRYDLRKTGSIQQTTENILRLGGTLPMPPQERVPQHAAGPSTSNGGIQGQQSNNRSHPSTSTSSSNNKSSVDLIQRLSIDPDAEIVEKPENKWHADPQMRAINFNKKKEYMVLQARKKFLEKNQS